MKCIFRYMKSYRGMIVTALFIKVIGTFSEFLIPYILEHLLDNVAPSKNLPLVLIWGALMIGVAFFVRGFNIMANRKAVRIASNSIYDLRKDFMEKVLNLSGTQVDRYGLPSLTSRMTADSYNVQNFIRSMLTLGVRAPILLLGGMITTLVMDRGLAMVLVVLVPIVLVVVILISSKGIPLYTRVQQSVDRIVRIMRENITGIRVVKALSKESYEENRYSDANEDMYEKDSHASIVMSLPGPIITLILNIGLTAVVIVGAYRVNGGITKPGVILAFLTYFNMILMGVGGLNRMFIMMSKASASAKRIEAVLMESEDLETVDYDDSSNSDSYLEFRDVSFAYAKNGEEATDSQEYELENISFTMERGRTLGIIGATGSGKTTIVNLLMRFYDVSEGTVYVDGRDVRTYSRKDLRKKFGVVFQNDVVMADTLKENIAFGREVSEGRAMAAVEDAQLSDAILQYEDGLEHRAQIHGANLSGGQKQRLLIARALAAKPEILILDDSSSALDYRTDAKLRQVIRDKYNGTTTIIIAQRISSIMTLDEILVLDDGRIVGRGRHEDLMRECEAYREIYEVQMS